MVTTTETTNIVTQPKIDQQVKPSWSRWLKHFLYLPASHRFFSRQDQHAISLAVAQAEQGHVGEIQVVIEGHIPANQAYYQDVPLRAKQLFAELGVWDTEHNSGVLLYLNLCERKVEIVIDRGINTATEQHVWDQICSKIIVSLKQQEYRKALVEGVTDIGIVLSQFYHDQEYSASNELANAPILLR